MAELMCKCAYKNCQHEPCEFPQGEAVKMGKRWMHSDCAEMYECITKTRDLYYEEISKTVVMSNLVHTIQNIVEKKKVDPRFLYFALEFAVNNHIPVKSPYSLHYLVDNNRIKELWKKKQSELEAKKVKEELAEIDPLPQIKNNTFSYSAEKTTGFGKIFGGT